MFYAKVAARASPYVFLGCKDSLDGLELLYLELRRLRGNLIDVYKMKEPRYRENNKD